MEWDLLESVVRVYTVRINLVFVTWITTLVYDNFGVMCIRSCTVVNRAMPYSGRVPRRRTTVDTEDVHLAMVYEKLSAIDISMAIVLRELLFTDLEIIDHDLWKISACAKEIRRLMAILFTWPVFDDAIQRYLIICEQLRENSSLRESRICMLLLFKTLVATHKETYTNFEIHNLHRVRTTPHMNLDSN
jgi:hypothetical protein